MHILIAPNAFKHSLDAEEVAAAISEGFIQSNLYCTCESFPIADGGDGRGTLIIKKCNGIMLPMESNDPLGRRLKTSLGLIDEGNTAIIEMASSSGIKLLKEEELNPLVANSFGTGEQIKAALNVGVKKIIIGMGGSATVDGATGMLKALGVRFLDGAGKELNVLPGDLEQLHSIDLSELDQRILKCEVVVLCDVDNLLLGENGSAAIFGPQKGASPDHVAQLDQGLAKLSALALTATGKDMSAIKYGGTAGGAAAGLFACVNAKLENGIEYFLDLTGFNESLENAELVITGEGSIDEQTLQGKGPFGVANRAKQKGLPVIGLAGKVPPENNIQLQKYFDALLPIGNQPTDLISAMKITHNNLLRTSVEIGNLLALQI